MQLKTDNRCRLTSQDLFKPNTPYEGESQFGGKVVVLRELVPAEVPEVRSRKVNGRWVGAEGVKLDRQAVVESVRQDRDCR